MVKDKQGIEIKVERKFDPKRFHLITKDFDSILMPGRIIPVEIYVVDEMCRECESIERGSFEGKVVCKGIITKQCEPIGVNWQW